MDVALRETMEADLLTLYAHQQDEGARFMAGFTLRSSETWESFLGHMLNVMHDQSTLLRTILADGAVVGNLLSFEMDGRRFVSYWLDRERWGRGIATAALREFLTIETTRPLYAYVLADNHGSRRVLEKCGFTAIDTSSIFSPVRNAEVDELLMELA